MIEHFQEPEPGETVGFELAAPQEEDRKMQQALLALVVKPGEATYRALHTLITDHPEYAPYSDDLKSLEVLYQEKRYEEIRQKLREMMPNWMLSPAVHQLACLTAKHLGDEKTAQFELQLAEACLQGLLASGDGTPERPYPVTHVEDEFDVLRHLNKSRKLQSLVSREGRHFDLMACEDGSEVWFDITALITHQKV
ncbi:MAG: DUF4919 domain-containing protein [Myxococcaceae bacterium]|nr:DUF4919 domain-containing protein [Myxococcaceae bacterium]